MNDIESPILIELIAQRMAQLGWNISDLARTSGVARPRVSEWLNFVKSPSAVNLDKLIRAMGGLKSRVIAGQHALVWGDPPTSKSKAA